MNSKIIIAVLSVFALGIIVAWNYLALTPQAPELERLSLGVERSILPTTVWVAEYNGYFKEAGIDVSIKEFDSGKASFLAMLNNEGVDISTVAPTPIMFNSFKRNDFSIIATFVYSDNDVKVIARKDKGISTVTDLQGKRIGATSGTTGQFFVDNLLMMHAIPGAEVDVVDISPEELPEALKNDRVDAIVIWEPHAYNAQHLLQEKAIRIPSSEVYLETFNFVMMKDFAVNNPPIIRKFLRAMIKATQFINQHKEKSQEIVANRLNLDKEIIEALWNDYVFEISLEQVLVLTLEAEARWAINQKLTSGTEVPNYLDYIYMDTLKEISPQAVRIIH